MEALSVTATNQDVVVFESMTLSSPVEGKETQGFKSASTTRTFEVNIHVGRKSPAYKPRPCAKKVQSAQEIELWKMTPEN